MAAPAPGPADEWPPSTLVNLAMTGASRFPATVFGDGEGRRSLAELADAAAALAGGLQSWGVTPRDRIALWLDNEIGWLDLWFAIAWSGGVIVPLNTRLTVEESAYVVRQSGARWLVHGDTLPRDALTAVQAAAPGLHVAAMTAHSGADTTVHALRSHAAAAPREQPDAVGMIQYTSGSTAFPKGAMLSHAQMLRNGWGLGRAWQLTEHDRVLCANPLFHCGGSVFAFLAGATHGADVPLLRRWDVAAAATLIEREGITVFPGIDAMVRDLIAHARATGRRCPPLRLVSTAADRTLFEAAHTHLGVDVSNVYGLTECSPNVCVGDLADPLERRLATIGRPQDGVEVDIREPATGGSLLTGAVGEIVVRGWNVMRGYFEDDAATARATTPDGFLRTGDLGSVDDDGYLEYRGRVKQMIKSGGENIVIEEVEAVLHRHPDVADAVLVPVPDARYGEVGYAYVLPLPGVALAAEDVVAHCQAAMARFKAPKHVEIVTSLPHTGSGKVDRQSLTRLARERVTGAVQETSSGARI